jgi:VWFA-related protein
MQATAAAAWKGFFSFPQSGSVVALDAVVTDKAGQPVSGLTASDFTLLVNNQPQTVLSVQEALGLADGPATEAILVVDFINTNLTVMEQDRVQLERFLLENNGQLALPTSLLFLLDSSGGDAMQTAFTQDGEALDKTLQDNLSSMRSPGSGGGAQRQLFSLRALERLAGAESKRPGRKLLIWIRPAWRTAREAGDQTTKRDDPELFKRIVALSSVLREARMTLYSIDMFGGKINMPGMSNDFFQVYREGLTKNLGYTRYGDLYLLFLSEQSGGRDLFAGDDLTGQIDRCLDDARDFYEIRFKSSAAANPDEYHTLSLQVDKPGVKVLTRAGYYAQP